MDLKDKIVVITGSSKGLGKALGAAFAHEKSKVVLSARSLAELQEVSKEIGAPYYVTDVTDEKQVSDLADFVVKKFGRIDIWINNAGVWVPHHSVEEIESGRLHEMMEVNLFGTIYGTKAALREMKKQGYGTIINVLSTSALDGRPQSSGYCASKFAANGFTKSLRLEAKPVGITVLAVFPGGMKTSFFDERPPAGHENFMETGFVAGKVIENLKREEPEEELIVRRP